MVVQKLISINKAAELLDLHPNTLKRWDKSGELKAIRVGKRGDRRYTLDEIENYLFKQRRARKIYPHVGIVTAVSVMVIKGDKVAVGKRTAEFGKGEYCFIGGSLAFGESFEKCAINEAKDKAGVTIANPKVICVTNNRKNIAKVNQQSITVGVVARHKTGELITGRPDRIIDFKWYPIDKLPTPMLEADGKIYKCYKSKRFYID